MALRSVAMAWVERGCLDQDRAQGLDDYTQLFYHRSMLPAHLSFCNPPNRKTSRNLLLLPLLSGSQNFLETQTPQSARDVG